MKDHTRRTFSALLKAVQKYGKQLSLFAAVLCGVVFCIMAMIFMTLPLEGDDRLFFREFSESAGWVRSCSSFWQKNSRGEALRFWSGLCCFFPFYGE